MTRVITGVMPRFYVISKNETYLAQFAISDSGTRQEWSFMTCTAVSVSGYDVAGPTC